MGCKRPITANRVPTDDLNTHFDDVIRMFQCGRKLPVSTSPGFAQTTVEGLADNWCHKSVEERLAIGNGGQFHFSGRPHNPTSRFWSLQTSVVTAESFFGQARATVMRATRNGVSPTTNYVTVEQSRQCHTSSTLVHWPNLTTVYCAYMKQMRLPSTGWQHMALSTR